MERLECRLDEIIRSLPRPFSGTLLVAGHGEILVNRGFGLANRSDSIPNGPETKYLLGSVTKQFTAVLTLKLVELGMLDLDETIDTYLPDYRGEGRDAITIHHLLSHTSGIPQHYLGIPDYLGGQDQLIHTRQDYLALIEGIPLSHPPGEGRTYTSLGFSLLGIILERVTGRSYPELIETHILQPLGLENTAVDNGLTIQAHSAQGYRPGFAGLVRATREEPTNRLAAGDIVSTTEDLFRFQQTIGFATDRILSAESKATLLQKRDGPFSYLGMVFSVPSDHGADTVSIVSHTGGSYGFDSRTDRLIEGDAAMIGMTNIQGDGDLLSMIFDQLGEDLLEILDVRPARPSTAAQPSAAPISNPPDVDRGGITPFLGF